MFRGQYFVQFVKLSINDFPISVLPFLYTYYNIILIKRKIATAVTNVAKQKKNSQSTMYSVKKRKAKKKSEFSIVTFLEFEMHLFTYSINYRQQRHATTRSIERARESLQCKSGVDATERLVHAPCSPPL